jgi:hypothetical protein
MSITVRELLEPPEPPEFDKSRRRDRKERKTVPQNEYFVPGDGIMQEVIQAEICRYLGNDALVKPGKYKYRQGYFIRAYRNLTPVSYLGHHSYSEGT